MVRRRESVKILEVGTVVLSLVVSPAAPRGMWAMRAPRRRWFLAIVLVSLAIGRPFTLQYAATSEPIWALPVFFTTIRLITIAWAGAFAVHVAADAAVSARGAAVARDRRVGRRLLVGAVWFTRWYPAAVQRRFAIAAAS